MMKLWSHRRKKNRENHPNLLILKGKSRAINLSKKIRLVIRAQSQKKTNVIKHTKIIDQTLQKKYVQDHVAWSFALRTEKRRKKYQKLIKSIRFQKLKNFNPPKKNNLKIAQRPSRNQKLRDCQSFQRSLTKNRFWTKASSRGWFGRSNLQN